MPIDSAEKRPYYVLIETNNALEGKTMATEYERKIIDSGATAFNTGKGILDNPFRMDGYQGELWYEGWRLARDVSMFKAMRKA